MKLIIRTRTTLTRSGQIGAYLLVCSPIAAILLGYMFFVDFMKIDGGYPDIWGIFALSSIAMSLCGYVMLSTGKETVSHAVSGDDAA